MREGWTEYTLGEISEISSGSRAKGGAVGSGVPSIGGEHIAGNRAIRFEKMKFVPQDHFEKMRQGKLEKGDSLLVKDGATTGKVGYWDFDLPAAVNEHVFILRPKKTLVESYFLNLLISFPTFRQEIESRTRGIIGGINKDIENIEFTIPPLPEQRRIADLISSIDSYIQRLELVIESSRESRKALFEKFLADGRENWVKAPLGDVLEISRGGSPRPIQNYLTNSPNGVNWVKISDASKTEKYIYSTFQKIRPEGAAKSRQVFRGDFILSNSMSFGRPYIMRTDGCIHDGWLLLSKVSSHFDEDFLFNLLSSNYVQRQFEESAAGSGVRNLNIESVKKITVFIPPKAMQFELSSIVNNFDNMVIKSASQLDAAIQLRSAVLSNLLSGKHQIPDTYDNLMSGRV